MKWRFCLLNLYPSCRLLSCRPHEPSSSTSPSTSSLSSPSPTSWPCEPSCSRSPPPSSTPKRTPSSDHLPVGREARVRGCRAVRVRSFARWSLEFGVDAGDLVLDHSASSLIQSIAVSRICSMRVLRASMRAVTSEAFSSAPPSGRQGRDRLDLLFDLGLGAAPPFPFGAARTRLVERWVVVGLERLADHRFVSAPGWRVSNASISVCSTPMRSRHRVLRNLLRTQRRRRQSVLPHLGRRESDMDHGGLERREFEIDQRLQFARDRDRHLVAARIAIGDAPHHQIAAI